MLEELVKEEAAALSNFNSILSCAPKETLGSSCDNNENIQLILEDLSERSGKALRECQLIESLDRQLRLLTDTREKLAALNRLNQLNNLILTTTNLEQLVPLVLEWRGASRNLVELSERSEEVRLFVMEELPELIDREIEVVLAGWSDGVGTRDAEAMKLLSGHLRLDSSNPLHGLFASYPFTPLTRLLSLHSRLGHLKRLQKMYPERLLNRFYDILKGDQQPGAFSVGQIEELVPEKMKYATRISCILEATSLFIALHSELAPILLEKCGQITRQIRKCAKEERGYGNGHSGQRAKENDQQPPAVLDAQLNEICLILVTLNQFLRTQPLDHLTSERAKWHALYLQIEQAYLMKGMQRAIEMDQIVAGETSEYPVSSCVDDIFYVLQAAKTRSDQVLEDGNEFIPKALREYFLTVLKRHLEAAILTLKPLNLASIPSPFKPTRELISTLVLINNLIATRSNWRAFSAAASESVDGDIGELMGSALRDGLYAKVLQGSVKRELQQSQGEDLFTKIHFCVQLINSLFKVHGYYSNFILFFYL